MPQILKEELEVFKRQSYILVQAAIQQQFNQAPPCKRQSNKTFQNTDHMEQVCLNRNKGNSKKTKDCSF